MSNQGKPLRSGAKRKTTPEPSDIDQRTLKLLVGLIAIGLASLCTALSKEDIDSISAAYFEGGRARDFFVGSLFAVSAFLIAYNGASRWEKYLSKIGAIAAMGVALHPCHCVQTTSSDPVVLWRLLSVQADALGRMSHVHYVAAAVLFLVLAEFCRIFHGRAKDKYQKDKTHKEARRRMKVYTGCGWLMIASLVVLALGEWIPIVRSIPHRVFYGEQAGLFAFGLSWLTASKVIPGLASPQEELTSGVSWPKLSRKKKQASSGPGASGRAIP